MDIYAPLAPAQERTDSAQGPPVGPLGLSAAAVSGQLQMERTSGAGICGLRRRGARPPERLAADQQRCR